MGRYFLAVDGGGTKTEVICAAESGEIVGKGMSGPTNLTSTSVGAASFNLIEALRQAVENLPENEENEFPVLVMGLAGLDSDLEHDRAHEIFLSALSHYEIGKFVLINDSLIALENGSENSNALVLISGTGSVCYGRNDSGKTARVSGMDYLLSDQGSGYSIGRRVLREAVKSYDGRSKKSVLEKMVCDYFKVSSVPELKNEVYHPLLTKDEIARLAPLCSEALGQGDQAAKEIFDFTNRDLESMINTVIEKLELKDRQFDLVLSGAVTKLPVVKDFLSWVLHEKYQNINMIFPETDPVIGALKLALKN